MQNKKSLGQKIKSTLRNSVATLAIGATGLAGIMSANLCAKAYAQYDFDAGRQVYLVTNRDSDPIIPTPRPDEGDIYTDLNILYSTESLGDIYIGDNTPILQANTKGAFSLSESSDGKPRPIVRPVKFQGRGDTRADTTIYAYLVNRSHLEINNLTLMPAGDRTATVIFDVGSSGAIDDCAVGASIQIEQDSFISILNSSFNWQPNSNPYGIVVYGSGKSDGATNITFFNNTVDLPDGIPGLYLAHQASLNAGWGDLFGNNLFVCTPIIETTGDNVQEQILIGNAVVDPAVKSGSKSGNVYITDPEEVYNRLIRDGRGDRSKFIIGHLLDYNPRDVDPNDTNRNGLPDDWEMLNFGDLNQTANGDFDGDGMSNQWEYLAGTNPNDSNDFYHVPTSTLSGLAALVGAIGAAGVMRVRRRKN